MPTFRFVLFLLLLFFAHLVFYQYLSAGELYPDLFLVLVVFAGLRWGGIAGSLSGFLTGIVQDSFSYTYFGLHALIKTLLGFAIGQTRSSYYSNNHLVQLAIIFATKLLHDMLFYGIFMFHGPGGFWHQILFISTPAALYTALLGVGLHLVLSYRSRARRWS